MFVVVDVIVFGVVKVVVKFDDYIVVAIKRF